jgi:hypothetical protein
LCPWSVLNCTHLKFTHRGGARQCLDCGRSWVPNRRSAK